LVPSPTPPLAAWKFAAFAVVNITHDTLFSWKIVHDSCVQKGATAQIAALNPAYPVFTHLMFSEPNAPSLWHAAFLRYPLWTNESSFVYPMVNNISSPGAMSGALQASCATTPLNATSVSVTFYHNATVSGGGDVAQATDQVSLGEWGFPTNAEAPTRKRSRLMRRLLELF
jgi:hypothetical protein